MTKAPFICAGRLKASAQGFYREVFHDTGLFHFGYPLTMPGLYRREGEGLCRCLSGQSGGSRHFRGYLLPDLKAEPGRWTGSPF